MTKFIITYEIDVNDTDIKWLADSYGETTQSWWDSTVDHMLYGVMINRFTEWSKAYDIRAKVKKSKIEYRGEYNTLHTLRKDNHNEII